MTQIARRRQAASLLDIVERVSLLEILQQAIKHRPAAQDLPVPLYGDLGLPPLDLPRTDTLS